MGAMNNKGASGTGWGSTVAIPGQSKTKSGAPVPRSGMIWKGGATPSDAPWRSKNFFVGRGFIEGTSKDSTGAALADCTLKAFRADTDEYVGRTVSDGAGAFSLVVPNGGLFYIVAYKAGSPDVAGTTVNTLIPTVFR